MIIYFALSILGGLWMPSTIFPQWLQDIAEWLPTHAYAGLGQAIELGNAPHAKDIAILVGYLVALRRRRGLAVPQGHQEGLTPMEAGQHVRPAAERRAQADRDPTSAWAPPPDSRRAQVVKFCWTLVYMLYIGNTVADLTRAATHGVVGHRARLAGLWCASSAATSTWSSTGGAHRGRPAAAGLIGWLFVLALVAVADASASRGWCCSSTSASPPVCCCRSGRPCGGPGRSRARCWASGGLVHADAMTLATCSCPR